MIHETTSALLDTKSSDTTILGSVAQQTLTHLSTSVLFFV